MNRPPPDDQGRQSQNLPARLARDGDPESIALEETDTSFQIAWPCVPQVVVSDAGTGGGSNDGGSSGSDGGPSVIGGSGEDGGTGGGTNDGGSGNGAGPGGASGSSGCSCGVARGGGSPAGVAGALGFRFGFVARRRRRALRK